MYLIKSTCLKAFTLILAASAIVTGAMAAEGESVEFTFAPGEKVSFVQKLTTAKVKDMGDMGKQVDESVSTTRITITQSKAGWDVLAEPQSVEMTRDGEAVDSPMMNLLSSAVIQYRLDASGNITDVLGYEEFLDQIAQQVPPEVFQQLAPVLNVEAMKAREMAEWNGRIGDYIGAELTVGDSFSASVPFQLPDGSELEYNVQTTVAAIEPCGKHDCVRISQEYDSDADSIAKLSGKALDNLKDTIAPEQAKSDSDQNTASLSGTVERLIDPDTMLVYEESSTRVLDMNISVPEVGLVPVKMTETRLYEFLY